MRPSVFILLFPVESRDDGLRSLRSSINVESFLSFVNTSQTVQYADVETAARHVHAFILSIPSFRIRILDPY